MAVKRRLERRATAAEWSAANTILGPGEIGVEVDTGKLKVGNGIDPWGTLTYITGGGGAPSGPAGGVLSGTYPDPGFAVDMATQAELDAHATAEAAARAVAIAALVDSSPATLDTLNELAAALGDDANFATTMTTLIGTKADTAHTHPAVTVDFSANVNAARPVTTAPVIWIGGSATPTNVDYTKGDIVIDATNGNVTLDGGTPSTPGDVLQIRRGTAAAWSSANPTPPAGVFCFETDTRVLKVGDGATAYNSLTAVNGGGGGTLTVQEDGTTVATGVTQLDIIGAGATAAAGAGEVTITIPGGGGGSVAVEEEGVEVVAAATRLDIVGAGATVTDSGAGQATITIPGGGTAPLFDRRTTDHGGRSLSTTLADDDQLGPIALEANKVYEVNGVFIYDGHDGGDIKFQLNGPAGAELFASLHRLSDVATSVTGSIVTNSIVLGSSRAAGAITGTPITARLGGLLITAGTAGDLTLQWAQNTSHATATRLLKGSYIALREIA